MPAVPHRLLTRFHHGGIQNWGFEEMPDLLEICSIAPEAGPATLATDVMQEGHSSARLGGLAPPRGNNPERSTKPSGIKEI